MKDKIMMFVIGVLVGAVIATGAFYVYMTTSNNSGSNNNIQMNGQPPEMPNGENGEPPEKPEGDTGEPPEKPSESTVQ